MGLTQTLSAAASGLRATQASLSLVSANVANADTPGYVRKTLTQVTTLAGDYGAGVRVEAVNRELDLQLQRQLRTETAGGAYADVRADFLDRLQTLYGQPGANGALETTFNNFTTALQGLSTSPQSSASRANVLNAAQALASQLNGLGKDIQGLRGQAEAGIADSVQTANNAFAKIAEINRQLTSSSGSDQATALLEDQRDHYIDQLSQLMDIRVARGSNNQVSIFTSSGAQLAGVQASRLSFEPQGMMDATSQWNADPAKSGLGALTLTTPDGATRDLLASGSVRSGKIAAYVELRDQALVQAQAQIDALAAAMAQGLSDRTQDGTAVTSGAQSGFDVDLAGILPGNSIRLTYTDNSTNAQKAVTLVRVDDPAALPLKDSATADPKDRVIGVDFSGGSGSVASQVASALGPGFSVSNPSGSTLRVLDDASGAVRVDAMSTTKTTTALSDGGVEFPFFVDGTKPFSGAITSTGSQTTGFANRVTVNPALLADPSKLVLMGPATAAGDPTRPDFVTDKLTTAAQLFSPRTGIGSETAPYRSTLASFLQSVIGTQAQAAAAAKSLKEGQDVVVRALTQRFADTSGVSIDQEMANLVQLQNAYAANARVMSVIKEMFDVLTRM